MSHLYDDEEARRKPKYQTPTQQKRFRARELKSLEGRQFDSDQWSAKMKELPNLFAGEPQRQKQQRRKSDPGKSKKSTNKQNSPYKKDNHNNKQNKNYNNTQQLYEKDPIHTKQTAHHGHNNNNHYKNNHNNNSNNNHNSNNNSMKKGNKQRRFSEGFRNNSNRSFQSTPEKHFHWTYQARDEDPQTMSNNRQSMSNNRQSPFQKSPAQPKDEEDEGEEDSVESENSSEEESEPEIDEELEDLDDEEQKAHAQKQNEFFSAFTSSKTIKEVSTQEEDFIPLSTEEEEMKDAAQITVSPFTNITQAFAMGVSNSRLKFLDLSEDEGEDESDDSGFEDELDDDDDEDEAIEDLEKNASRITVQRRTVMEIDRDEGTEWRPILLDEEEEVEETTQEGATVITISEKIHEVITIDDQDNEEQNDGGASKRAVIDLTEEEDIIVTGSTIRTHKISQIMTTKRAPSSKPLTFTNLANPFSPPTWPPREAQRELKAAQRREARDKKSEQIKYTIFAHIIELLNHFVNNFSSRQYITLERGWCLHEVGPKIMRDLCNLYHIDCFQKGKRGFFLTATEATEIPPEEILASFFSKPAFQYREIDPQELYTQDQAIRNYGRSQAPTKAVRYNRKMKKSKTISRMSAEKAGEYTKISTTTTTTSAELACAMVGEFAPHIPESNIGNKLLQKMGWVPGSGLGAKGEGIKHPIAQFIRKKRAGLDHSNVNHSHF